MQKPITLIILIVLLLSGCNPNGAIYSRNTFNQAPSVPVKDREHNMDETAKQGAKLRLHFIDLGQADAILIQTPAGESILIDAGGNDDEEAICAYLRSQHIQKITLLIGTHPHEDHIGGLDAVINSFPVGNIYLPRITHNTRTFEDLLQAIKERGLKIKTAQAGISIPLQGLECCLLSPNGQPHESLNDYSAVFKLNYGQQGFLFCGDAGSSVESEMVKAGYDLKADLIKIGHHGSNSSSSAVFLSEVAPDYAIISCGQDNPYGHPHLETLAKLKSAGIGILRTDQLGTIVITADGKEQLLIETTNKRGGR